MNYLCFKIYPLIKRLYLAFSGAKLRETFEFSKSFRLNEQRYVNFLIFVKYVRVHVSFSVNIY